MKGRRRARRMALQALYALDQSAHALPRVLHHRVADELAEAAGRALPAEAAPQLHPVIDALAEAIVEAGEDGADPDALRRVAEAARAEPGSDPALVSVDPLEAGALWTILGPHAAQAAFGARIVFSVLAEREALDATIEEIAPEFPVPQMAPVDRNVLRIALWEIASGTTPLKVAINEAVELAREFSGESSRRMVNGALGTFAGGAGEATQG